MLWVEIELLLCCLNQNFNSQKVPIQILLDTFIRLKQKELTESWADFGRFIFWCILVAFKLIKSTLCEIWLSLSNCLCPEQTESDLSEESEIQEESRLGFFESILKLVETQSIPKLMISFF